MNDAEKYKKGLRWALAVIVLLFIIVVINIAVPRDRVAYDQGYVDGWNGCVEAQTELMEERYGQQQPNITIIEVPVDAPDEGDGQIGIIS